MSDITEKEIEDLIANPSRAKILEFAKKAELIEGDNIWLKLQGINPQKTKEVIDVFQKPIRLNFDTKKLLSGWKAEGNDA